MVRFEPVSSAFELPSKLGVIINFAVKNDYQLIVQGGHRLCAGGDIKDREAPVAKKHSGMLIDPGAFAVRSAMRECIGHPMQVRAFSAPDKSGNPAHGWFGVWRLAFGVWRLAFGVWEHIRFQILKIKVINQLGSGFAHRLKYVLAY